MCTLYWEQSDKKLRLLFNRDEQRNRQLSGSLEVFEEEKINYLCSIDKEKGGTWLGANTSGFVVAVLNADDNYTKSIPTGERSRGLLVKDLLSRSSFEDAKVQLEQIQLNSYSPFILYLFSLEESLKWRWSGMQISQEAIDNPFETTSSYSPQKIKSYREGKINLAMKKGYSEVKQLFLNGYGNAESVCMDREDARTVSHAEIELTNETIHFEFCHRNLNNFQFEEVENMRFSR